MNVPFFDVVRATAEAQPAVEEAALRVLRSGRFILGDEVQRLEEAFAAFTQSTHAVGVSSGTDALLMALTALGVGPGDEVIVPEFTFFAPAGCVSRLGATPVFVDIDAYYGMDPEGLKAAITPRTRAVVAVHLFGQACAIDDIAAVCDEAGVPLIEDCAQAIGVEVGGRHVGHHGLMSCYSFFPTKNLGAAGDGGMVTTRDAALDQVLRRLRVHGAQPKYVHQVVGGNFRLDALQAAVLGAKLPFVPTWTEKRRANARYYDEHLAHVTELEARVRPGVASTYHQFVVEHPERDALVSWLTERGVETAVYYPMIMSSQPCFVCGPARNHAHVASTRVLALPVFPGLREGELAHVVDAVASFPG